MYKRVLYANGVKRPNIKILAVLPIYEDSSTLACSHSPFRFSFHTVTLLSPPDIASAFPLKDQLTLQTTLSNCSTFFAHTTWEDSAFARVVEVQIMAVLSWEAEAMYALGRIDGAQATSIIKKFMN